MGAASPRPRENRVFRDYLTAHTEAARRYEAAKRRAAALHPDSRARYGAAEEAAMRELMAEAGLWAGLRGESR
ncbi:GrpB family protein [Streptomyces ferrugineus]|uniref:GrpB family protein n=1 Tax=Streptomyces ferrugineus TaxID=1413221 RepID=UPI001D148574|nr:GrpB family protein [Streptomyces ferrugineus]